jgi:hypothetical protein
MVKKRSKQQQQHQRKIEIPKEAEVIVFNDPTKRREKPQQPRHFDEGGSRTGKITPVSTISGVTGRVAGSTAGSRVLDMNDIDGSSRKITEKLLKEVEEFSKHTPQLSR